MKAGWLLAGVALCLGGIGISPGVRGDDFMVKDRDVFLPEEEGWKEEKVALPAPPQDASLIAVAMGPLSTHRVFVDDKSLSVGQDGVVRYTLVVRTAGGATNISYEGIRCGTLEYRVYALGGPQGAWSLVHDSAWKPIENRGINRQRAVLSRDFFCPAGESIRSAAEGLDALRRGRHPKAV
ncbi:MAG: CNP1-like family protein [Proteobacteria bacterium]|nr:CNP1-like family protein [Pseudomonadota bacterium]HQR05126.1 CNP1-like family protein [Rhodocyclaceae bacterium]